MIRSRERVKKTTKGRAPRPRTGHPQNRSCRAAQFRSSGMIRSRERVKKTTKCGPPVPPVRIASIRRVRSFSSDLPFLSRDFMATRSDPGRNHFVEPAVETLIKVIDMSLQKMRCLHECFR